MQELYFLQLFSGKTSLLHVFLSEPFFSKKFSKNMVPLGSLTIYVRNKVPRVNILEIYSPENIVMSMGT
jgi:hypothetical protein